MDSLGYLFAAYALVWLGLAAYLYYLARSVAAAREEMRGLLDAVRPHAASEPEAAQRVELFEETVRRARRVTSSGDTQEHHDD